MYLLRHITETGESDHKMWPGRKEEDDHDGENDEEKLLLSDGGILLHLSFSSAGKFLTRFHVYATEKV